MINFLDSELIEQCKSINKPSPSTEIGLDLVDNLINSLEKAVNEEEPVENEPLKNESTNLNEIDEPDSIDGLLKQLALRLEYRKLSN